jgi:hypothetical protein
MLPVIRRKLVTKNVDRYAAKSHIQNTMKRLVRFSSSVQHKAQTDQDYKGAVKRRRLKLFSLPVAEDDK